MLSLRALWVLALLGSASVFAQGLPAGEACGCPAVASRDTVLVSDNNGAGVGTQHWTCDHIYVLTEQVFVNAGDTLTLDPGTVVLGVSGEGRTQVEVQVNFGVGSVRDVTYESYPGALVVAREAFLDAQGTDTCPIHFSFMGDPMDGSVGVDVQGQWGGGGLVWRSPNQHPSP